jgi:hypothetical protein
MCALRKLEMLSWSGCRSPASTRNATSSYVAFSIFRDDGLPTQYAYKSSVTIISGWYAARPRSSFPACAR